MALAIVITVLILAAASTSYWRLNDARNKTAFNLAARHQLLSATHVIRTSLSSAYTALDLFLLKPDTTRHRNDVIKQLDYARAEYALLNIPNTVIHKAEYSILNKIIEQLMLLETNIQQLMEVRLSPQKQYPAMQVGNEIMAPNRNNANNAFALAVHSMNEDEKDTEIYLKIIEARHLWTQLLSNFRLYLANRVGSFDVNSLRVQENAIETMNQEVTLQLAKLLEMNAEGLLGFQTAAALAEASSSINAWYGGFTKVREINHSDQWRMDAVLIQRNVSPGFQTINRLLTELETSQNKLLEEDIRHISLLASQSNGMLLILAVIAIGFVYLLVLLLQKLVFRPIMTVSQAMKAQALGKTGHELPIATTTETRGLIDAFNEMRRQITLRQNDLEYRALHDALTSLPNRVLLFDLIKHDLQLTHRSRQPTSLMVIDLDRFKEVNDTLGHHVGDKLLIEVGARFSSVLRETDTVARLGGDEFSILLPGLGKQEAGNVAEKIQQSLSAPFVLGALQLPCSASIGISTYPEDGPDAQSLLQHADVAMYQAKKNQTRFEFYDVEKDEYSLKRLEMVNELRQAIELDQLDLVYQPIINIKKASILGVESLLRWNHPQHGPIAPELIVQTAEQTGLITRLSYYVLNKTLQQQKIWRQKGLGICVSVNFSMLNLGDKDLVAVVTNMMQQHDTNANELTIEITESAMMSNPHRVINVLHKLEAMQVKLSIDDFGTGFSSLSYLKKLPVNVIKIDRSFIVDLENDINDQAIVSATLSLGHDLGLMVIAEGVETAVVQEILETKGCDAIQGHHISRPLTPEKLEQWLLNSDYFNWR